MKPPGEALVALLQQEHRDILAAVDTVRLHGVTTPAGRSVLTVLRPLLFNHLAREDEDLYPPLRKAASSDPELAVRLDAFVGGMEVITGLARDLLGAGGEVPLQRQRNLGDELAEVAVMERFFAALRHRIVEEENVLYQEYLRVVGEPVPAGD
jgi:hypothetical protein